MWIISRSKKDHLEKELKKKGEKSETGQPSVSIKHIETSEPCERSAGIFVTKVNNHISILPLTALVFRVN